MKHLPAMIAATVAVLVVVGVAHADDKREGKPRFKGVELYSFKDKGGEWVFVLLDGTNRLKTEEEVKATKNPIKGVDNLKKELAKLAEGEMVFWTHPIKGFDLPPDNVVSDIKKSAAEVKVTVSTGDK